MKKGKSKNPSRGRNHLKWIHESRAKAKAKGCDRQAYDGHANEES